MSEFVLGLDGGGTKTVLAVANRAGELREVIVGTGINPFDQPAWKLELERILALCSIKPDQLAFSSFGMPGYGESKSVSQAQLLVAQAWAGQRCKVQNDVALAFVGALAGAAGVLVLAGTGSMTWGRNEAGQETRVGGWGEGFGDEGSAYWIGILALQKLSWAIDGRLKDGAFHYGLLEHLGIQTEELVNWFYTLVHKRSTIAALAKRVDQFAEAGNETAQNILLEAANQLIHLALATQQQLHLEETVFSFAGSVFKSFSVREIVRQNLAKHGTWQQPKGSPIAGALLDAAQNAGWSPDSAWLERVNTELGRKHL